MIRTTRPMSASRLARISLALALLGLISACAHESPSKTSDQAHFSSPAYGVAAHYPASLPARHGFTRNYFMGTRWNPDAPKNTTGKGLLTLTLPQSNKLMSGQLRLGARRVTGSQGHCALPEDGNTGPTSNKTIGGITFRRRDTHDAGMNHFLFRHAYRGIVHGRCYAIDLIVSGTNPGVYPGNPTPPMSKKAAFKQLQSLLQGFSFPAPPTP